MDITNKSKEELLKLQLQISYRLDEIEVEEFPPLPDKVKKKLEKRIKSLRNSKWIEIDFTPSTSIKIRLGAIFIFDDKWKHDIDLFNWRTLTPKGTADEELIKLFNKYTLCLYSTGELIMKKAKKHPAYQEYNKELKKLTNEINKLEKSYDFDLEEELL